VERIVEVEKLVEVKVGASPEELAELRRAEEKAIAEREEVSRQAAAEALPLRSSSQVGGRAEGARERCSEEEEASGPAQGDNHTRTIGSRRFVCEIARPKANCGAWHHLARQGRKAQKEHCSGCRETGRQTHPPVFLGVHTPECCAGLDGQVLANGGWPSPLECKTELHLILSQD
jgi:hypothetical protein